MQHAYNPSENWGSFVYRDIIKEHVQMASVLLICLLCMLSHVLLFVTPCTIAWQVPQSVGFSRQESTGVFAIPSSTGSSHPGIKPASSESPALAGGFFTTVPLGKPY